MFLTLIRAVDPVLSAKLHDDNAFRPYTLSPLGVGEPNGRFDGFHLPRQDALAAGTPCFFRATLLDDALFPTFARYFLERAEPGFRLGATEFTVTDVRVSADGDSSFSRFTSYAELMRDASQRQRRIALTAVIKIEHASAHLRPLSDLLVTRVKDPTTGPRRIRHDMLVVLTIRERIDDLPDDVHVAARSLHQQTPCESCETMR